MLLKLADHISNSYARAAECEEQARQSKDKESRANHLEMARAWRHGTESFEFVASLERFVLDAHKKGLLKVRTCQSTLV